MQFMQDPTTAATLIENFVSSTLIVPVVSDNSSRLSVSEDYPGKYDLLRKSAETCMSAVGHPDRASDLFDGLMSNKLKHDLWYVQVKNGPVIILVKEGIYRQIPEREIAEQVHKEEVESAVLRGEQVPDDLLQYYRRKSNPVFSQTAPM